MSIPSDDDKDVEAFDNYIDRLGKASLADLMTRRIWFRPTPVILKQCAEEEKKQEAKWLSGTRVLFSNRGRVGIVGTPAILRSLISRHHLARKVSFEVTYYYPRHVSFNARKTMSELATANGLAKCFVSGQACREGQFVPFLGEDLAEDRNYHTCIHLIHPDLVDELKVVVDKLVAIL